jgi:hypothetical protein
VGDGSEPEAAAFADDVFAKNAFAAHASAMSTVGTARGLIREAGARIVYSGLKRGR